MSDGITDMEIEKEYHETIWEELDRFIGSIKDEIRSDEPDRSAIDFWLFKIERRIEIIKKAMP